jgi:tripartite-type tricarboxylate transporter receptor subunit TctC
MDPSSMAPQAFSAYIDSEIGKWTHVIKAAHVKAD